MYQSQVARKTLSCTQKKLKKKAYITIKIERKFKIYIFKKYKREERLKIDFYCMYIYLKIYAVIIYFRVF